VPVGVRCHPVMDPSLSLYDLLIACGVRTGHQVVCIPLDILYVAAHYAHPQHFRPYYSAGHTWGAYLRLDTQVVARKGVTMVFRNASFFTQETGPRTKSFGANFIPPFFAAIGMV